MKLLDRDSMEFFVVKFLLYGSEDAFKPLRWVALGR